MELREQMRPWDWAKVETCPEYALLFAVIHLAFLDANSKIPELAQDAVDFLTSYELDCILRTIGMPNLVNRGLPKANGLKPVMQSKDCIPSFKQSR